MPTEKMQHQNMMEILRPTLSAIGAAIKAPNKVPIDSFKALAYLEVLRFAESYLPERQLVQIGHY
jgi:hypothetical protein